MRSLEAGNMEEKCIKCGRVLFRKVVVDNMGHTLIHSGRGVDFDSSGFERFVICPSCRARNAVANVKNLLGVNELKVTHVMTQ